MQLEKRLEVPSLVRTHFTGCPNSCGQAQVADIGLMGAPAKKEDPKTGKKVAVSGYNILEGGAIGQDPALAEVTTKGIPGNTEDLVEALEEVLIKNYGAKRK